MEQTDIEKTIQALLFATDKPLSAAILAQVVEIPHKQVVESIEKINERLKEQGSPISIKQIAGGYEYLTMPEYSPYIKKLYKNRFMTRLSRPALEVLSIVSYKQPISKQEVETIRGVNSDGVYYTLLERKLIKIVGRKDAPGRPLLYGTTREFLQYLGINSLEDLPKLEEVQSILEKDESIIEYVEDRKGHDRRYAMDSSKIKNELGWEPETDFSVGIKKTIEWYTENPGWWRKLKDCQ